MKYISNSASTTSILIRFFLSNPEGAFCSTLPSLLPLPLLSSLLSSHHLALYTLFSYYFPPFLHTLLFPSPSLPSLPSLLLLSNPHTSFISSPPSLNPRPSPISLLLPLLLLFPLPHPSLPLTTLPLTT